jgi:hypothetical protein
MAYIFERQVTIPTMFERANATQANPTQLTPFQPFITMTRSNQANPAGRLAQWLALRILTKDRALAAKLIFLFIH